MDEPRLGLRPIIPRYRAQGPSPLIPVIVLVIVGFLRWMFLSAKDYWTAFEPDYSYDFGSGSVTDSLQPQFTITLFLVPVVLLLAIHAFGIPQVNPVGNAQDSPFVKAITQNLWSSFFLMVVIMALLMSIPMGSFFSSQPAVVMPPGPVRANPGYGSWRGSQAANGICQEIGILKRRCENWKGSSRDIVCRDLASLQKRCESYY